jgi:hypothetical protein
MPLLDISRSNSSAVARFSIEQIVSAAGNRDLRHGSECSIELRAFLREAPTGKLAGYVEHCLSHPFSRSGSVLQDIANELGRRFDFAVENGRHQGVTNDWPRWNMAGTRRHENGADVVDQSIIDGLTLDL